LTTQTLRDSRRHQLEARINDYHSVTVAEVLEVIDYLRDDKDSVIAGGSLAVGLGNRLSDLDVVIAGEQSVVSSRVPLEHFVRSLRVDVWKMSKALIDDVFERAERGLSQPGRLDDLFANVDDEVNLKLLHRIAFGITLDGPGLAAGPPRDHVAIARNVVVREYAERMREHAFLAQLSVAHDRPLAAAVNARDAVEEALHAAITASGVPFTGHKWLQERLANDVPDLRILYAPFATLPAAGEEYERFVLTAIEQCEALAGITLAADRLSSQCRWANTDLVLAEAGDSPLLLSANVGGLWQLDDTEADAWRVLMAAVDGSRSSLVDWSCSGLDQAQAALCFDLYERGLLKLIWCCGVPLSDLNFATGSPR
jgi:hypothetical protein